MRQRYSIRFFYSSRVLFNILSVFFILLALLSTFQLEAGGWGKSQEVFDFEGTTWNGIYFDMNGLHFTALIPNYNGTTLENDRVFFGGGTEDSNFAIITSFNAGFTPPKSKEEFIKIIQKANSDYLVSAVDSSKFGAKYVVDLIPIKYENAITWRFLSTNDRLIKMGTSDTNKNRQLNFFESIVIY